MVVTIMVDLVSGGLIMEVTGAGDLLLSSVVMVRAFMVAAVSMVVADDNKVFIVYELKALPFPGRAFSFVVVPEDPQLG